MSDAEKTERELLSELLAEVRKLNERLAANDVPSEVVTYPQACAMLGCGKTKLYELIKQGRLQKAERLGREPRLVRASVEAMATAPEGGTEQQPDRPRRKPRAPKPLPGESLGDRVRRLPI